MQEFHCHFQDIPKLAYAIRHFIKTVTTSSAVQSTALMWPDILVCVPHWGLCSVVPALCKLTVVFMMNVQLPVSPLPISRYSMPSLATTLVTWLNWTCPVMWGRACVPGCLRSPSLRTTDLAPLWNRWTPHCPRGMSETTDTFGLLKSCLSEMFWCLK